MPTTIVENSAAPIDGVATTINNKFSANTDDVNSVKFTTEHHQHQDILIPQYSNKHIKQINTNSPNECSPIVEKTPIITTDNINHDITNLDTKISNTESSPEITTNQLDIRNSNDDVVIDSDNSNNGENSNSESTTILINNEQNTDRVRRSISDYIHRKYEDQRQRSGHVPVTMMKVNGE